jgi:protease-4
VANELTITGSIGVIMHSLNYRGLMDKVGLRPEVYKSGKFKDMLSGTKREDEITSEEKEMIQKLINETFEKFKSVVADGREHASKLNQNNKDSKGRTLSKNWADFADGRVLSGKEAYQLGFVDELGSWDTALDRAEKLAKLDHRPNLVQYQQSFSLGNLFKLFGKSEGTQIKVDLGMDLPKLQAGRLYFLSPTFVH